ncbi:hypothetical protein L950_0204645 [Sphingobacterium sp. IITKGP-BTPF85]|nr:hypothetical protein L950_0204645 [Sphingobacterium sp. IITKGP-BTPF85]
MVSLSKAERNAQVVKLAPILRGFCSSERHMIGHFTDDERVLEFINSNDLDRLAPLGTSCPDHFLRTKIQPLVLNLDKSECLDNVAEVKRKLEPLFAGYREMYEQYYDSCKHENSPAIRDKTLLLFYIPVLDCSRLQRINKLLVWLLNFILMPLM